MGRPKSDYWGDQNLGNALRYLRKARGLRQGDVVSLAEAKGEKLSLSYYAMVERGEKAPSDPTLNGILSALDSDPVALEEIKAAQPWEAESHSRKDLLFRKKMPSMSRMMLSQSPSAMSAQSIDQPSLIEVSSSAEINLSPETTTPSPDQFNEILEITSAWPQISQDDRQTIINLVRRFKK